MAKEAEGQPPNQSRTIPSTKPQLHAHRSVIAHGHGRRLELDGGSGSGSGGRRRHRRPRGVPGRRRRWPARWVCRGCRLLLLLVLRVARHLVSQAWGAVAATAGCHATAAAARHGHGWQVAHTAPAHRHGCRPRRWGLIAKELRRRRRLLRGQRVIGRPSAGGKRVVGGSAAAAACGRNGRWRHRGRRHARRGSWWRRVGRRCGAS